MNWLQNIVILVSGFLLSEILIAAKTHYRLIAHLLSRGRTSASSLLGTLLAISYGLSIFFSNTVVVLAMLPVTRRLIASFGETKHPKTLAALFYCALVFGANTGGMASLTGNALNVAATGFADFHRLPGIGNVTFFSWLLIGVPSTLALAFSGAGLLRAHIPPEIGPLPPQNSERRGAALPKKPLFFFLGNVALVFTLGALQFLLKPPPLAGGMNGVDIAFLTYLLSLVIFSFIIPRKSPTGRNTLKNIVFFLFFVAAFPLLFTARTTEQLEKRLNLTLLSPVPPAIDRLVLRMLNAVWRPLFGESFETMSIHNFNSVLSVNLIILEIPYFGLFLMGATGALLLAVIAIGDNPLTPQIDGVVFTALGNYGAGLLSSATHPAPLFVLLGLVTVFATEFLSNTTILLVLAPAILSMPPSFAAEPLLLLLLVTVSASGAFMSPIATPVNALAFGGLENVSLKTVLKLGFFMNIIAALWISLVFLALSLLL